MDSHALKGNIQLCQKYKTTSLISHPSKVMLKVILNSLKPQAEEIIDEEQTEDRAGEALQNRYSTSESYVKSSSACSLMGHHAEVQYQCISSSRRSASVRQGFKCSSDEWQHRRIVQNNRWRKGCLLSPTLLIIMGYVGCTGRT